MFRDTKLHIDTSELLNQINDNINLFGANKARTAGDSPHRESLDIWFRFGLGDNAVYEQSQWLDASSLCPSVKDVAYQVMKHNECGELGGILCTKLPAGNKIHTHVDVGWHAERYKKYYIPIQADGGCEFVFDGEVIPEKIGSVWEFDNSYPHWVNNNSGRDRVALIICMR
tara:strand:+ start:477 stop:989 length:513 start_codon:yes stop_codon:yes gene_type:complete